MISSFTLLGFICLFSHFQGIQYKSYMIRSRDVPSYMYQEFKNVIENIFPRDLRISASLSKFSGTLLYSIDNFRNQFIVSLDDTRGPSLTIKSSKLGKSKSYLISDLCGCDYCNGEVIDLRFQMKETAIFINCNNGEEKKIKFDYTKRLDTGYPNPFADGNDETTEMKVAHLWIVNFDGFNGVSHNSDQLVGCILDVTYRDIKVNFTNVTSNIGHECKFDCVNDICNGGKCYEAFNGNPRCNCTATLLNGMYCNETSNDTNVVSWSTYSFKILKLSWENSTNQIIELQNKNMSLSVMAKCNRLIMAYRSRTHIPIATESILSESYISSRGSILIAHFNKIYVDVKLFHNGEWTETEVLVRPNIEKEIFVKLALGSGIIGMAYKTSIKEIEWRWVLVKNSTVAYTSSGPTSEQCAASANLIYTTYGLVSSGKTERIFLVLFAITAVILIVLLVIMIYKRNTEKPPIPNIPVIECTTDELMPEHT